MSLKDFDAVVLITGTITEKEKTIGKCHCYLHKGYLTKKLVKSHQCLEKSCHYFEKVNFEYWASRNLAKTRKKMNRYLGLEYTQDRDALIQNLIEEYGPISVIALIDNACEPFSIWYTSEEYINLEILRPVLLELTGRHIEFHWESKKEGKPSET